MWIEDRPFTINGRTYTFVFKSKALMEWQKLHSHNGKVADLFELRRKAGDGDLEHVVGFVWAGLRKHHPDVTVDDVWNWIDESGSIDQFVLIMAQLLPSTVPDAADLKELGVPERPPVPAQGKTAKKSRGTGERSTSTRADAA